MIFPISTLGEPYGKYGKFQLSRMNSIRTSWYFPYMVLQRERQTERERERERERDREG